MCGGKDGLFAPIFQRKIQPNVPMLHTCVSSYVLHCGCCRLFYWKNAWSAWIEAVMINKHNLTTICIFWAFHMSFTSITSSIKWEEEPGIFYLLKQDDCFKLISSVEYWTDDTTYCCWVVWWTPDFKGQWEWCSGKGALEITHSMHRFTGSVYNLDRLWNVLVTIASVSMLHISKIILIAWGTLQHRYHVW